MLRNSRTIWSFLFAIGCVGGFVLPRSDAADKPVDWRAPLTKLLTEIEALPLEPWPPPEESEVAKESNTKSYRIVTPPGTTNFVETLPTSPEGIAKLWVLQNPPGTAYVAVNGRRELRWNRLYWQPREKRWAQTHPNHSTCLFELAQAKRLRSMVAETGGTFTDDIRAGGLLASMSSSRKDADAVRKSQQELREVTARLGRSWNGADLLYRIYNTEFEIEIATGSEQKVALAKTHRSLLRQAVTSVQKPAKP